MTTPRKTAVKGGVRRQRPFIGALLREKFMEPLGITFEQLCLSFPPGQRDLRWLFEFQEADMIIIVSVALALDRVFGLPHGHIVTLWADCGERAQSQRLRWLKKVKPIGLESRKQKFAALAGSTPGMADVPPAKQKSRRRKRVLLPAFKAMMALPPGNHIQATLEADRSR